MGNDIDLEKLMWMYRFMVLTREFEEAVCRYHASSPLPEMPHSSIGQEAVAVGVCAALRPQDVIIPSLRTRGAFLSRGVPSNELMAGVFAKDPGTSRGRYTSHHMGNMGMGIVSATMILGSNIPTGVGTALASKMQKEDCVSVVFFGDGSSNRGDFHEGLNMAGIWKLPVIFVIENNQYAISTPVTKSFPIKNIADRAAGYGMPGVVVDGNDVLAVYQVSQQAVNRAMAGEGPTLIECKTYRWREHSERPGPGLRPQEEVDEWISKCPIKRLRLHLIDSGSATEKDLADIDEKAALEVSEAIKFAESSPYPPVEAAFERIYTS